MGPDDDVCLCVVVDRSCDRGIPFSDNVMKHPKKFSVYPFV
jgi:hypothetical protein